MYACICMYVYVCMYLYACICMYVGICMCVCMYVCVRVCVCIHAYVCMHNILGGIVRGVIVQGGELSYTLLKYSQLWQEQSDSIIKKRLGNCLRFHCTT